MERNKGHPMFVVEIGGNKEYEEMERLMMRRFAEALGSVVGVVAGGAIGAVKGASIGIAVGGPVGAIAGTVPCAIAGAVTAGLAGNKIGTEIDRKNG